MRIEEASKLMEIPTKLISEIIDEHQIPVEQYLNGNHDLDFDAMVKVYSVYIGSHRNKSQATVIKWRQKIKVLQNKVRRLEKKVESLKVPKKIERRQSADTFFGKKWYPKKIKSNVETV